jgi:ParB family chromosome partitioning protein
MSRLSTSNSPFTGEEREFAKLQKARDTATDALNAYYDDESAEEDEEKRDALEEAANAARDACDAFVESMEAWLPEQLETGGAFVFLNYAGEVLIEWGFIKREDMHRPASEDSATEGTVTTEPKKKVKPVHSEKLCRRLTAHRTAAVQVELAAQPGVALAVLMNHMIPTIFADQIGHMYSGRTLEAEFTCTHNGLLREADDLADSRAWKEIEAERAKWTAMLPKNSAELLPWLLEQSDDVTSNLFAFCVAATLDSVCGADGDHPLPAFPADCLRHLNQTVGGKLLQQRGIGNVPAFVVIAEQISTHKSTSGLVGFERHERDKRIVADSNFFLCDRGAKLMRIAQPWLCGVEPKPFL